ncbi:hypothetical protein [Priestia megaterium]
MYKQSDYYIGDILNAKKEVIPKLRRLQEQFDINVENEKVISEQWRKKREIAYKEFKKREKELTAVPKPLFDMVSKRHNAVLFLILFIILRFFTPLDFNFFFTSMSIFSSLLLYGILTLFLWVITLCVLAATYGKFLDLKEDRYRKNARKKVEEMKKREFPILTEQNPASGADTERMNFLASNIRMLKRQYPMLDYDLKDYDDFNLSIEAINNTCYLLEKGYSLDEAHEDWHNYYQNKMSNEIAEIESYFAEKEKGRRKHEEYMKEKKIKEEISFQREREERERNLAVDVLMGEIRSVKQKEALEQEIKGQLEAAAMLFRQEGRDREQVRHMDDQLGRSHSERLAQDRMFDYKENDHATDRGGEHS